MYSIVPIFYYGCVNWNLVNDPDSGYLPQGESIVHRLYAFQQTPALNNVTNISGWVSDLVLPHLTDSEVHPVCNALSVIEALHP